MNGWLLRLADGAWYGNNDSMLAKMNDKAHLEHKRMTKE